MLSSYMIDDFFFPVMWIQRYKMKGKVEFNQQIFFEFL